MDAKTCTVCGKTKPYASFHVDAHAADGYRAACKVCRMREGKANKRQGTAAPRAQGQPAPQGLFEPIVTADAAGPNASQNGTDDGADLTVEAPAAEGDAGKPSGGLFADLMDAMKGTTPASGPKPPKSVRDEQEAMSAQLATFAGFLGHVGATLAIPDPYKPCAPTAQHGYAITKPLAEILAEKMDVAGHLSPTVVRLAESAMALLMYGDYALRTYLVIREKEMQSRGNPPASGAAIPASPYPGGYPSSAAAAYGDASTSASGAQLFAVQAGQPEGSRTGKGAGNRARPNRQARPGAGQPGAADGNDPASKIAAVDALLEADAVGRRQLGLVG